MLGTVHSVFDHAVNLEIEGRYGLIGLIAREKALTPYAVSVRTAQPFLETDVRAGMAAAICGGRITISQAALEIDLNNCEPVDLSCDSIEIRYPDAGAALLKSRVAEALREADVDMSLASLAIGGEGNAYTRFLAPRLENLYAAVSAGATEAAVSAAMRIAGCGMGLTPSSDDFLCGYLTAVCLIYRMQKREHLRGMLARMAQAAAERTNRVSATFLLQSGEGLMNLAVRDLYRSTFQFIDEAAAERAIGRVLDIGSTSGADILTGLMLALMQHNGGNEP